MAQDGLSSPTPFVHDFVRLSVFMRYVAPGFIDGDCMSVRSINLVGRSPVVGIAFSVVGIEVSGRRNDSVTVRYATLRAATPHDAKMIMIAICGADCSMTMGCQFIGSEGGKMKVFQILNGQVTIIQGSKVYIDSLENFKSDSGVDDLPGMVLYDESQKCCVVDSLFYNYPNDTYEGYLAKLPDYLDAKAKREYVPPAEPTVEEKKTALTADYNSGVEELSDAYNIATLRGDTEAQESIKQDFADLQEAYKAEMEALK